MIEKRVMVSIYLSIHQIMANCYLHFKVTAIIIYLWITPDCFKPFTECSHMNSYFITTFYPFVIFLLFHFRILRALMCHITLIIEIFHLLKNSWQCHLSLLWNQYLLFVMDTPYSQRDLSIIWWWILKKIVLNQVQIWFYCC